MKRLNILAIVTIAIGIVSRSYAQSIGSVSAAASATATIIRPIAIVKNLDMSFGNIAISASQSGTVVLDVTGVRTTGGAGGVTLPAATGTVSAAKFTVSGQMGYSYVITLPTSCIISSGSNTMTVNSFISNPATGHINSSGSQVLRVGATSNVSAGQPPGTYTNPSGIVVTVNYN